MKIVFHQRKFALNINKSTGYFWSTFITHLSTVSDLTQQIMIQTKSKGSPAIFLPQATLGLLLRSPIFFFSPVKRGACSLATTYTENRLKALSTTVIQMGELRPTFFKPWRHLNRVKQLLKKDCRKNAFKCTRQPFLVLWVVFLSSRFPACFSISGKA